ncbi:hypothetical protein CTA2_10414 [Colletotrichum tanaceti]|uniref:Uncharacterized protein n=1 Tax=Colletotrichum tanaceti TaxID=1306861 RepID=A0A4V6DGJ7_9PEZI|nr:hypothetical protein CTA2_10414 [Colletotrichum tanaceti]TKW53016.1 hypothetical protein CTA1_12693 [Colletotrichum tanaceti]
MPTTQEKKGLGPVCWSVPAATDDFPAFVFLVHRSLAYWATLPSSPRFDHDDDDEKTNTPLPSHEIRKRRGCCVDTGKEKPYPPCPASSVDLVCYQPPRCGSIQGGPWRK